MKLLLLLVITVAISQSALGIVCPDGRSKCPHGRTCCKLESGKWACCPLPEAVCCSDGEHCCPNGYTCDVSHGTCLKEGETTKMLEKIAARKVEIVVCPDGQSLCPDDNTCCKLPSGEWGCCPIPKAVCCSDHLHCCPEGQTCDVSAGKCNEEGETTKMLETIAARKVEIVVCPDGRSECPDNNTCCKLPSGEWGCCPIPNAVCCSDHLHCCPEGQTCDVSAGKCNEEGETTKMLEKIAARKVESVVCPDGETRCPDGNTCCKLPSGEWGCCPIPNAVCCSDHLHCCPEGYTCGKDTCNKEGETTKMLEKIAARKVESVVCPDGRSECPDGNTCCKLATGQWGCCPLPKAVCCSDGEHCCPNGYTCNDGQCSREGKTTKMFRKIAATRI